MKVFVKSLIVVGLTLGLFLSGMIAQKYYGLGNIIKKFNPSHVPSSEIQKLDPQHYGKLSIFILAGQSNMEGDGDPKDYQYVDTKNRVYAFDDNYQWKIAKEPLKHGRVGPSISFAKQLIDADTNTIVGIINCARGGTNIRQWSKSSDENSMYLKMIKKALAASTQGEIKGVLFFQGENDTEADSTDHYEDWDLKFEEMVKSLRKDFENDTLPIIFAQIGKGNNETWKKVKARQESVNMSNVVMIKTDDLDYYPGNIHFTTDGYVEIGRRFGDAWLKNFGKESER